MDQDAIERRASDLARFHLNEPEDNSLEALMPLARHAATLEAMLEEADHQARHDALTGLLNRRAILERLEHELRAAGRTHASVAVLLIDVDHFKAVNDTHGHLVGDEVLRAIGATIRQHLRATDAAGRYGGEELLVVTTGSEQPEVLAQRLLEAVRQLRWAGSDLRVTISAGLARADVKALNGLPLLARADAALYKAKAEGRDQVRHG